MCRYSNPRITSASSDVLMGRGRPGAPSNRSPGCGPTCPSLVQVVLTFGTFSTYPHADFPKEIIARSELEHQCDYIQLLRAEPSYSEPTCVAGTSL